MNVDKSFHVQGRKVLRDHHLEDTADNPLCMFVVTVLRLYVSLRMSETNKTRTEYRAIIFLTKFSPEPVALNISKESRICCGVSVPNSEMDDYYNKHSAEVSSRKKE